MKNAGQGFLLIVALIGFFVCAIGLRSACAPGEDKATAALRAHGFKDARITASHYIAPNLYGCDEKDAVAHNATATNPNGERVTLVVCCGMVFKGCTVRTP